MYYPGDLTFAAKESSVIKRKEGDYVEKGGIAAAGGSQRVWATFAEWMKANTGPYEILFDAEKVEHPMMIVRQAAGRFAKCKNMSQRFDCAEEAFHVCREVPELFLLYPREVGSLIKEMAFVFLLYDDIAAHPVWLHSAQEAMRCCVV
jgi:hypothetical protein